MRAMSNEEIMELTIEDFRELTPQESQHDNFRRMFQLLVANNHPASLA